MLLEKTHLHTNMISAPYLHRYSSSFFQVLIDAAAPVVDAHIKTYVGMHLCRQTTFKVVICSLGHFFPFINHANCPPAWRTAQSLGMVTWMGVLRGKGQPKSLPLQCQVGVIPKHTSLWSWIYQKWSQRGEEHPSCCSWGVQHGFCILVRDLGTLLWAAANHPS